MNYQLKLCSIFINLQSRALPDITSGPEVRQIFKVRTVQKPDLFPAGHRTLKFIAKNQKSKKKSKIFQKKNFTQDFFCLFAFDPKFVSRDLSYEN